MLSAIAPLIHSEGLDEAAEDSSAPDTGGDSAMMPVRSGGSSRGCAAEQVSFLGRVSRQTSGRNGLSTLPASLRSCGAE